MNAFERFVNTFVNDFLIKSGRSLRAGLDLAKVKDLNINGENLHQLVFIKNKSYHKYMELCEMEIAYVFHLPSAEGTCKINLGFRGYFNKRISSIEFVVDVAKVNLYEQYTVPEYKVRQTLIKEFEAFKTSIYDSLKPLSNDTV